MALDMYLSKTTYKWHPYKSNIGVFGEPRSKNIWKPTFYYYRILEILKVLQNERMSEDEDTRKHENYMRAKDGIQNILINIDIYLDDEFPENYENLDTFSLEFKEQLENYYNEALLLYQTYRQQD